MTKSFQFYRTPSIYFGESASDKIPSLTASLGRRAILVTGSSSLNTNGRRRMLVEQLCDAGVDVHDVCIRGEPSPEIIDSAVQRFSSDEIDVVIAIGGGSVIDAGKAMAAMMPLRTPLIDYLESVGTRKHPGTKLPFIAVPTTAGTGSEATKNAVISRVGADGFKASLRHDNFTPDVAVVDPRLAVSCPPEVTAACGLDALTQLLESYISTNATPLTDALAPGAIKAIFDNIVKAYNNGGDMEARSAMAYGALVSGITLANAGLGIVHGLASPLGAHTAIPHGMACSALCAPAFRKTIERLKTEKRIDALAKCAHLAPLINSEVSEDIELRCETLVKKLYELNEIFSIPPLSLWGIRFEDCDAIASKASNKNNPVSLTRDEIAEILAERL